MKKITELVEYPTCGTYRATFFRRVNVVPKSQKFIHFITDLILFETIAYCTKLGYVFLCTHTIIPLGNTKTSALFILIALLSFPFFLIALYIASEYLWQRTPGKYLTKSIVVDEYGNKPKLRTIIFRNLIRIIPFECFSGLGETSSCWHDKWSKTFVVPEEELVKLKRLQEEQSDKE